MTIKPAGRYGDLGPLHDLLLQACPPDSKGKRSIMILAARLGVSYQRIYQWIEAERIPPKRVKDIVTLADGAVLQSELLKYVL